MRRRTEKTMAVIQYLLQVVMSKRKKKEMTVMSISKATGVKYNTVLKIVHRLEEDKCIKVYCYMSMFSEINHFSPHAAVLVGGKKCRKNIFRKYLWLINKA